MRRQSRIRMGYDTINSCAARSVGDRPTDKARRFAQTPAMAVRSDRVSAARAEEPAGARPLQVLLIEDSPLIREAVTELVESVAFARVVATADSEAAALEQLQINAFDVAIVDLKLKEGTGFGVLRALQDSGSGVLAIVFTNFATPAIRKRCTDLGAAGFFDKSSDFEAIGELIARRARRIT